jgi:hypothetical protein
MTGGTFGDRLTGRCSLRIRHDAVFTSSVLFTVALVSFIRPAWWNVLEGYGDTRGLDVWRRAALLSFSSVGELTLALVFIGLIVTWTGYLNKVRWAWFVMFILASGLAFQLRIFPFFVHPGWLVETVSDMILIATGKKPGTISWDGAWWGVFCPISIFLLMVIALFLPVKSFFSRQTRPAMGSRL